MEILFFIAGGLSLVSTLFYIYKIFKKPDFGYLLMIFSRVYFVGLWAYHFFAGKHVEHETFLFLLSVLMFAEVLNSGIFITSRKFIKRIQENEIKKKLMEEYEISINSQLVGFFIVSKEGQLKYSNNALTQIIGYSKQEMLQKNILDIVYPEDISKVRKEIELKLKGEKDMSMYDFRIIDKEGRIKKVKVISSVITNGHTSIAGSLFLKED